MSDVLPTVRVKSGESFANINMTEFDPTVHELFDPADAALLPADPAPEAELPFTAEGVLQMAGLPFLSFKSAAGKVLGADCPSTKADIIEALKAKIAEGEQKPAGPAQAGEQPAP